MRIIATVYKSPLDVEKVKSMIGAGADVLRIKFAHETNENVIKVLEQVQAIIDESGAETEILADLPECKVRLGGLERGSEDIFSRNIYTLRPGEFSETVDDFIPVSVEHFADLFRKGDKVSIGDGEVWFEVTDVISPEEVKIKFPDGGFVDQYRSLMSPRLGDVLDHYSQAVSSIELFGRVKPEYLALSFVGSAAYVNNIKERVRALYGDTWQPKIVAKIESAQGIENIKEIAQAADEVVVGRGDLGLTIEYPRVILEQKKICSIARESRVPITIATQILDSCLHRAIPARSEISDLTNLILDGAGGIWLSQETSLHHDPGKMVKMARRIVEDIKKYL